MIGTALAIGQGLYGLYNAIKSGQEANDYQARMERMARQSPLMKESPEVANYYQQALNRYNENVFNTPYYLESLKQAERSGANAINQAQERGAGIGLIGKIDQGVMDQKNRAIVGAIANKNAEFGQLGGATQMKKNERDQMFDINQMTPYNRMFGLQQLKTQAANDRYNAGLNMLGQGLSNVAQLDIANKMYNPKMVTDNTSAQASSLPVSYKTPAMPSKNTSWATPFDYKSFQPANNSFVSANPEAWGSYTGDFSKSPLNNNFGLPKTYNNRGFNSIFGSRYPM
jgi:hypothetical protein